MSQPCITARSQALGRHCKKIFVIHEEQYFESSIPANHFGEAPQHGDKSCHLSDCTSTTHSLNESRALDASGDHLLELDSTSLMSQLQDISRNQIEFVSEFEDHLDHVNLSQTDVFLEPHGYELFLLSQAIHTPSDSLSHLESHVSEKLCQDDQSLMVQSGAANLNVTVNEYPKKFGACLTR